MAGAAMIYFTVLSNVRRRYGSRTTSSVNLVRSIVYIWHEVTHVAVTLFSSATRNI